MSQLTQSGEWKALEAHYAATSKRHMRELFAQDPKRFEAFSVRFEEVLLDYSKNRITAETMELLRKLARAADLSGWTEKMFTGQFEMLKARTVSAGHDCHFKLPELRFCPRPSSARIRLFRPSDFRSGLKP